MERFFVLHGRALGRRPGPGQWARRPAHDSGNYVLLKLFRCRDVELETDRCI